MKTLEVTFSKYPASEFVSAILHREHYREGIGNFTDANEWRRIIADLKGIAHREGFAIHVPAWGEFPEVTLTSEKREFSRSATRYNGPTSMTTSWADCPELPGYAWEKINAGTEFLVPAAEVGEGYIPGILH